VLFSIILCILFFSLGWVGGAYFKGAYFDNLNWQILKWDSTVFGYRPVVHASRVIRGDKLIMGLEINPITIPEEGLVCTED